VLPQCDLSFRNERSRKISLGLLESLTISKGLGLWKTETKENYQNRWTCSKPEERTPSMGRGIDKSASESRGQEVPKCIALLKHARYDASSCVRAIFQSCRSRIAVQATHCNPKESSNGQELAVGLCESSTQLQHDEEDVVNNEGPFSAISICCDTKYGRPYTPEH
jgi:hypothetical protein